MHRRAIRNPDYDVPIPGFSHAVEAPAGGRLLFISGITSRDAHGEVVGVGSVAAQARRVLEAMEGVLREAGGTLDHLVQLRTYLRAMDDWGEVEEVWKEVLTSPWPASTAVEVSRLTDPRQLVETDAIAVLPSSTD